MSEQDIENEIQDKGLDAPRLTPEHINSVIAGEQYHVFPDTTLTVCCLRLVNGFTVTGESAAASPENFDEEIGKKIARENARDKIWQLEGYLLKQRLHDGVASGESVVTTEASLDDAIGLPRYKCHKVVRAGEISKIEGCLIHFFEGYEPIEVDPEFIVKHPLNRDGYLVIYEDGYLSFSPKAAFEGGYTPL